MPEPTDSLCLTYCSYSRAFARPLQTAHGTWARREGILIRLEDASGKTGFGEIAPLPGFGSETLEEATNFIEQQPGTCPRDAIERYLKQAPPASAFAIWSALKHLDTADRSPALALKTASIFTLDSNWEASIDRARAMGTGTFKIKVGVQAHSVEQDILEHLLEALTSDETVRLDPNMSWDIPVLKKWTNRLSERTHQVEFIEEPLKAGSFTPQQLVDLAGDSPIALALDESISTNGLSQWLEAGWPGYWVIKPSLLGVPRWADRINPHKVVLSSVFETGIGMTSIIAMAKSFTGTCHGMGTGAFFKDNLSQLPLSGHVLPLTGKEVASLWKRFCRG